MRFTASLRENRDFRRLYAAGKSCVGHYIVVYMKKNRTNGSRLGITVSSKFGNAVTRNRARRRIKEIYRLYEPSLKPGYDIVVVARGRAAGAGYAQLDAEFKSLCARLQLVLR